MESLGVKFLRVDEADVKYDMQNVIRALEGKVIEILKGNKSVKLPEAFDLSLLK